MLYNKDYRYCLPECDIRIKGTTIYVKCFGIGVDSNGNKGIKCEYQNGPCSGAREVIPGDCLIEEHR